MELTAIVTGLLLAIGALAGLTGLVLHAWTAGHPGLRRGSPPALAGRLARWLAKTAQPAMTVDAGAAG